MRLNWKKFRNNIFSLRQIICLCFRRERNIVPIFMLMAHSLATKLFTWDRKANHCCNLCAKVAATSALSSSPLAKSPGCMIYVRLGQQLFVSITDESRLEEIDHRVCANVEVIWCFWLTYSIIIIIWRPEVLFCIRLFSHFLVIVVWSVYSLVLQLICFMCINWCNIT